MHHLLGHEQKEMAQLRRTLHCGLPLEQAHEPFSQLGAPYGHSRPGADKKAVGQGGRACLWTREKNQQQGEVLQPMSFISLIIIFVASAAASAFGTLIGGTSLITIPLLIVLGLPPHTAIGTDRFGVMGIGWAGLYKFHHKKFIDYRLEGRMDGNGNNRRQTGQHRLGRSQSE
ncbi:MAG: sulfite exporter TauE/SafE family protein [Desulfobacterales bacterium]|nr:sulfite exporter TauE/SafE family protein [Desulfobacterales bacterium]